MESNYIRKGKSGKDWARLTNLTALRLSLLILLSDLYRLVDRNLVSIPHLGGDFNPAPRCLAI